MAECLLLKAGGGGVDCDAATAMKSDVLAGKTFGGKDSDELQGGSMPNQGAKTATLAAGGSYTIPAGYHNGSGKVTANSLASQTSANAAVGDIIKNRTAWVNGAKRTGTLEDRASQTNAVSVASSTSVGLVRIPFGAYRTKTGSGYPEIVLNKSQIDYIAKQRYGGTVFNGAAFDGVTLTSSAAGYLAGGKEVTTKAEGMWGNDSCYVAVGKNIIKTIASITPHNYHQGGPILTPSVQMSIIKSITITYTNTYYLWSDYDPDTINGFFEMYLYIYPLSALKKEKDKYWEFKASNFNSTMLTILGEKEVRGTRTKPAECNGSFTGTVTLDVSSITEECFLKFHNIFRTKHSYMYMNATSTINKIVFNT